MAKQFINPKKEFVQKYLLDDYSRALPARLRPGNTVSLGDYCDPVDSTNIIKHDGDSSDSDSGYALPEDSIGMKNTLKSQRKVSEEADVYELAHQSVEGYDIPPPPRPLEKEPMETRSRKPSPKPRGSQNKKQRSVDNTGNVSEDIEKLKAGSHQSFHGSGNSNVSEQIRKLSAGFEPEKRRPSKKVVEIEYEVASSIRPAKPELSSSSKSINQPQSPSTNTEALYEEPWDLKLKRLKQEEEEKKLKKSSKSPPPPPRPNSKVPLYEDAWDSVAQQKKLEEKLSFARSVSQTSEADIFHDAVDSIVPKSNEAQRGPMFSQQFPTVPEAPPAYEDAWDLKTSIIDMKIKQMQLQASATYEEPWESSKQQKVQSKLGERSVYEEPWDSSKQQQKLQSKLERSASGLVQMEKSRHRSSSDAYEQAWEQEEQKKTQFRGKSHSVDERAKMKSKGCNVGQRINPMIPLVNQNWYHGNISRDDAEKMLCVCKEGSYIVRISSDRKSYSLSIKSAKQYIHVQIEQVLCEDGGTHYILGKNSKEFPSIPEMIDYYTCHRVPLKGAEHITLLHPVECKWS